MSVKKYIDEKLSSDGALVLSLIDPLDYRDFDHMLSTAKNAYEGGIDIILIGGSIGVQGPYLDKVAKSIKEVADVPVVLFPGNIATLTPFADATYFMSLLNSRNTYWITRAQMLAAPVVKQLGIETLSVAYLVAEPGGSVGFVGEVDLLPRNNVKIASAYAMAAELMGFEYLLTDAGSNPHSHIPLEMIRAIRASTSLPFIVAGGIKTPEQAANVISAGADCIQVGTAFEGDGSVEKVKAFVTSAKEAAKKRR